jgi:hypothetical protein
VSTQSGKLGKARLRYIVSFVLLLLGWAQLFSSHSREMLLSDSIAVSVAYGFCHPREPGESFVAYVRDPGNIAMLAPTTLGGGVFIYWLVAKHF